MPIVGERVKQIMAERLGVQEDEVTPNASFVDVLAPARSTRSNW
jgi:acyl carrier protein